MTSKVVGIDGGKKPDDEPCQFCNAVPACRALTCPRLARIELWENGTIAGAEFFEPEVWQPRAARDK